MKKMGVVIVCLFFFGGIVQMAWAQDANQIATTDEVKTVVKQAVEIKQVEPFYYAAIEKTGSYDQHEEAFMALYGEAGKQGLPMDAMPFGLYHNSPQNTPEDQLKWEVGLPLPEKKDIAAPLVLKKWEFTTVASSYFEGPFEDVGKVYPTVFSWIGQNGYAPAGPIMEKYLSMPGPDANGVMSGKVEIVLPVQK